MFAGVALLCRLATAATPATAAGDISDGCTNLYWDGGARSLTRPVKDAVAPSRVVEDAKKSWLWMATTLSSSGYVADLSPASLREIDRFFDEQSRRGKARPGGLLSRQVGARLFAIGAYVGEVIRRARGGEWIGDDGHPKAASNVAVRLTDGTILCPVQRVTKRFKTGTQDGIAAYGLELGLEVEPLAKTSHLAR